VAPPTFFTVAKCVRVTAAAADDGKYTRRLVARELLALALFHRGRAAAPTSFFFPFFV
jgi:hypothetical protein